MSDKPKYVAFTTPAGEAVNPWITKPDTLFNANGEFKVDLSVPFEEAQSLIAQLEQTRNDFIQTLPIAKQKALTAVPVCRDEYTRPKYPENSTKEERAAIRDAWEGDLTGNVLFRIKMKAKVTTGEGETFTQQPVVVHADTGAAVEGAVFGGSIIRVKGQIVPYTNSAAGTVGITLRMKAVQVIEQVSGGGDGSFWSDFDE